MKRHIRCIGVPEHFNLPWHLAIEKNRFQDAGVTLLWNDEPKGTGAMCAALNEGSTDLAVMVSTGTVRECLRNPEIKVIATYVDSPLTWGVHVPAGSDIRTKEDAFGQRFAISRNNSGSHLMAHVYANQNGWEPKESDFEIVHDLNGCRKAFEQNPDLLFLWERFTTAFLVDLGEFRLIDEIRPPWPCFLVAARTEVLQSESEQIKEVLRTVRQEAQLLNADPNAPELVAERYHLPLERAKAWFKTVSWSTNGHIDPVALTTVANTLHKLNILDRSFRADDLLEEITYSL